MQSTLPVTGSYCQTCYSALWKDSHRVVEVCAKRHRRDWFTGNRAEDLEAFVRGVLHACILYGCTSCIHVQEIMFCTPPSSVSND